MRKKKQWHRVEGDANEVTNTNDDFSFQSMEEREMSVGNEGRYREGKSSDRFQNQYG